MSFWKPERSSLGVFRLVNSLELGSLLVPNFFSIETYCFLKGRNRPSFLIQGASSVSTARGECRASWPCRARWATTRWRTSMWWCQTLMWWPLTLTNYSLSSWSWPQMACGTRSATRRPCVSSVNASTSRTSEPRASCYSHSTAAAPITSLSWWWSSKAPRMENSAFIFPVELFYANRNTYFPRIWSILFFLCAKWTTF